MNSEPRPAPFLIVGIGASAGGVEALKDLFTALPVDAGLAYVVIQHLEPHHVSHMADILGACTSMTVVQAEDGMPVLPDRVYTNPAGGYLSIADRRLVLIPSPEQDRIRLPIDHFLTSLAEDQGEAAACIILTGSGADGTRGVRAIYGAGGLCLAQHPDDARFPAMPHSAIDTGLVDDVLSLAQMPAALLAYATFSRNRAPGPVAVPIAESPEDLESILELMRVRANSDYRHYKQATIARRIHRRMALRQAADIAEYHALLLADQRELTQLSRDMLIGVSRFFRDPEAFAELRRLAIDPLVAAGDPDLPLRAWVAGCATGEEAYTVAMLLHEAVAAAGSARLVQVFASDLDDRALEIGRAGVYPDGINEAVSRERLEFFFTRQGEQYQVDKRLRESVVFSRQDLITDPPFSRLDLISCRNLLIYIQPPVQKKILAMFKFALNPGGYLFLGKSEGVAEMHGLFEAVSKPKRIYRSDGANRRAAAVLPLRADARPAFVPEHRPIGASALALMRANQAVLLKHFGAAIVLVDPHGQILHFFGETERFLGHPKGLASLNVLDIAPGALPAKLRKALDRVRERGEVIGIPRVPMPGTGAALANLAVMQVPAAAGSETLLAIIFEDAGESAPPRSQKPLSAAEDDLVTQLEEELKVLRNELRADAEGFGIATEELKAANEEVMSMNEELQSANEELEASKEELQSLNEELTTVNNQLSEKLAELTATSNDLANLFAATEIATVFLDSQLRIKRFTPRATELLNLLPADVGRPIGHITVNFDETDLTVESERTLRTLAPLEKEVHGGDGRWHTLRILPYRTLDDRIDGVIITLTDVTRLKQIERERRELESRVLHGQKLESLGVLAGGIAHDFNNILTAVIGNLDLAKLEYPAGAPAGPYVDGALDSALQAARLTEQMLAYAGGNMTALRRADLNVIIRDMMAIMGASITRKVPLEYRLADTPLTVLADMSKLSQVILNLVVNAAEAAEDAKGTITVTTSDIRADRDQLATAFPGSDLPGGHYALLEVRDTGCGMDQATIDRVFEPFFTTKFTGRGLGLAAVQGIVKSHHGAVAVDSELDRGSVFRVILPADAAEENVSDADEDVDTVAVTGSATVLIIDDERTVRDITADMLDRSGFTVLTASDGAEGLEIFRQQAPDIDLVLLDVTMPGIGTQEILAGLRLVRGDVMVALCSGYSELDVSSRFADEGVVGFIQKPFAMSTLVSRIARWL